MPRFFFNLVGRDDDEVGHECRDLKEARAAAVSYLGSHLQRDPPYVDEGHWRVDVLDARKALRIKVVVAVVEVAEAKAAPA